MASTNKTTHYELSQYVGTDKPTYLTDYNNDMSAIDTGIYNAQTKADSAYTVADVADGKADTGITNAGLAQADATTALTRIGTMANLNTTEKSSLVGAINEVNTQVGKNTTDIAKFNFTTFTEYNNATTGVTVTGGTWTGGSITIAKNSDGSVCKIYGKVYVSKTNQTCSITLPNTGITPSDQITVSPSGLELTGTNSSCSTILNSNGNIELKIYGAAAGTNDVPTMFIPFVIFVKDFGDTE